MATPEKISELQNPRISTPEDQRKSFEQAQRKINEIIRALNQIIDEMNMPSP